MKVLYLSDTAPAARARSARPKGQDRGIDRTDYPFQSRWVDLSAGRMHYVDEGQGETILFVHGTPTWSLEWRHMIRAFAGAYRCIAPDLIGFGHSDRPREFAYTPEAHARVLAEFVERLNLSSVTLVVHDFGGPIGLPICLREPERVKRLVLLNTWMWSLEGDVTIERAGRLVGSPVGRFLYRWANVALRVLTPAAYADRSKLNPRIHKQYVDRFPDRWSREAVLWPLAQALLGSSDYFESLWWRRKALRGRPTLILWGMADRAFRPECLDRWTEALPAARIVELYNVGHWPHEEAPERVIRELQCFLAGT
jgi:pimeloyl-ACP methyl ester carboxylesterase